MVQGLLLLFLFYPLLRLVGIDYCRQDYRLITIKDRGEEYKEIGWCSIINRDKIYVSQVGCLGSSDWMARVIRLDEPSRPLGWLPSSALETASFSFFYDFITYIFVRLIVHFSPCFPTSFSPLSYVLHPLHISSSRGGQTSFVHLSP